MIANLLEKLEMYEQFVQMFPEQSAFWMVKAAAVLEVLEGLGVSP